MIATVSDCAGRGQLTNTFISLMQRTTQNNGKQLKLGLNTLRFSKLITTSQLSNCLRFHSWSRTSAVTESIISCSRGSARIPRPGIKIKLPSLQELFASWNQGLDATRISLQTNRPKIWTSWKTKLFSTAYTVKSSPWEKTSPKAEPKFSCCYFTARTVSWATLRAQVPHTDVLQLGATETCSKVYWNPGGGKSGEHCTEILLSITWQEIPNSSWKCFSAEDRTPPATSAIVEFILFPLEIRNFWDSKSF